MQEHQATSRYGEKHSGDPPTGKRASHFPQPASHGAANGHAHGPAVFNGRNVTTYFTAIVTGEIFQPVSNGFSALGRSVEKSRDLFEVVGHVVLSLLAVYLKWYLLSRLIFIMKYFIANLTLPVGGGRGSHSDRGQSKGLL